MAVPTLAALCMLCCDPCMHACMHAPSFRSVNQARLPALRLWCYVWSWWSLNVKRSEVKRVHRIVPTAQTRTAPPPVPRTYLCLTQTPGSKTETKHKQNVKHVVCVVVVQPPHCIVPCIHDLATPGHPRSHHCNNTCHECRRRCRVWRRCCSRCRCPSPSGGWPRAARS